MLTYLTRLSSERDTLTASATTLAERAATEDRDLTDTEQASMRTWAERCAEIDAQLVEFNAQVESQRAYARLRADLDNDADDTTARVPERRAAAAEPPRTWGDLFVESDAFADYNGAGTSARVDVPSLLETRAAIMTGDWPGTVPPYVFTPPSYGYVSPLLDVVGRVTVSANAVEWVKWAPNPQAAATIVAEGELKPEAAMTAAVTTDTLDTYAHWKAISRQALEDIPQIRSIVEGRLRQGITVALEGAVSAALTAATLPTATGATLLEAIRVGVATVEANGYGSPNAVLLNPADWAALDVAVMGVTNNGPAGGQSFWGMRPVSVPTQPAGTATVGLFTAAVTLFARATTALYMTDSHADYFVRNLILLLAEQRAFAAVPEPAAACECTAGAPGGASAPAPSAGK